MLKKINKWVGFTCILIGSLLFSLIFYKIIIVQSTFLTTHSPKATYTVNLVGQKERPLFFTNEVRFNVLKDGNAFWSDQYLHSGDSFDISFEVGYPDYQWLDENILHFYREEDFTESKPEIAITNNTNKVIMYMKLESQDKFLIFDMQPNSEIALRISSPKGDYPGLKIQGKFSDEQSFREEAVFKLNKKLNLVLTYHVYFIDNKVKIESPFLFED